ncbi:hypothetical protein GCM10027030_09990 [Luteococcus sediminum]
MCGDHEHGERRCGCCDPAARRAARREARMRERGLETDPDRAFCAATVAERAAMTDEHPEAAFDPSPTVRAAAARGPLTEEVETALAGDETARLRRSLASNPACTAATLDALSMDEDQAVRVAVSKHTSTPPETLEVMAAELDRRRDLAIARALASNPHTPIRTLEDLLQIGTGGWRTLAGAALRERAEVAAGAVLDGAERAGDGHRCDADRGGGRPGRRSGGDPDGQDCKGRERNGAHAPVPCPSGVCSMDGTGRQLQPSG